MFGSINMVILVGYLGNKPDISQTQYGEKWATFRLATSESWLDKNSGERRERTEWHSIVIYNEALVKVAEQYLDKGSKIYIEGKLQTRKWQDGNGNDQYKTEIVLQKYRGTLRRIDSKRNNTANSAASSSSNTSASKSYAEQKGKDWNSSDDDIPF